MKSKTLILTVVSWLFLFLLGGSGLAQQVSYGPLLYQDDFSSSNSLWKFSLTETRGNQTAIDASYGKVEGGVLTLKANVGCGWDYLASLASLQMPLPTNYIIEYRARKMQFCGQFDGVVASSTITYDDHSFDSPWFAFRMEGNWFNTLAIRNTPSEQTVVPPVTGGQNNGSWYSFKVVRRGGSLKIFMDGALQWSYSGPVLSGGFLHFSTSGAGSTVEVDDLKIYGIAPSLEIEVAAVRLKFFAESNRIYNLQWSTHIQNWTNLVQIVGVGATTNFIDWTEGEKKFYRLVDAGNLNEGLVAYYPFNGNAYDESGNGNDGIVTGATTLGTNRLGVINNSYIFTPLGSFPTWGGSYIATANANGFPTGSQDFTVSFWVNLSQYSQDHQLIFANREVNQFQFGIFPFTGGTQSPLAFYTGGSGQVQVFSDPLDWSLGRWYNLQMVRASNVISVFRDGVLVVQNTVTQGNTAAPSNRNLDFGWRTLPGAGNHPLWGQLDDVRIYNRALTADEVSALFRLAD